MVLVGDLFVFSKKPINVKEFKSYRSSHDSHIEGTYIVTDKNEYILMRNVKKSECRIK